MDVDSVPFAEGPVFRALLVESVKLPVTQREGPQSYRFVIFVSISYNCVQIYEYILFTPVIELQLWNREDQRRLDSTSGYFG